MAIHLHVAPDPRHLAVSANQHRGANDPEKRPAIQGFFAPRPIRLQHLMRLVGDQRNRKLVLVAKALLRTEAVRGDSEHLGSGFGKRGFEPGEVDGFPGATWRIRTRVEEQDELLAGVI